MKIFKSALLIFAVFVSLSVPCFSAFAQTYDDDYPSYVPVSGGAFIQCQTGQGTVCVVVPIDYQRDTFGFSGSGYDVVNITNSTVSGTVYKDGTFSYYGNPRSLSCRFTSMGTLEVYAPYYNGRYEYSDWTRLSISSITSTNCAFMDETGNRYNNEYLYSTTEKILILFLSSVMLIGVGLILWRWFHA